MDFPQRYDAAAIEGRIQQAWADARLYEFSPADPRPIFAIDTPPPTVSGEIHIGHVYSYVQAEAIARFWRMQGRHVYYPFGFDDNGLPTERFVEQRIGARARDLGRQQFIDACLAISHEVEDRFETFWKSLGFSVDWRLRYSTIDPRARRTSQHLFIDLFRKGRIYRAQTPNPWCVECRTAIAQAEIDDVERATTFYTLAFTLRNGANESATEPAILPIATTRPELLPACVAVFVHPDDSRYRGLIGARAGLPLLARSVPILADAAVDPAKGSGAVMCCTFGDTQDVAWWREHHLPLIPLVGRDGILGSDGGAYAGLRLSDARARMLADMRAAGLLLAEQPATQTVRTHERCGTPLEIIESMQWFIRILDAKEELLAAGRAIAWHPAHMLTRYEHWVKNLGWDWCISRQRMFGVPFPAWHCDRCGAVILAAESQLPVDPLTVAPPHACACGNHDLRPDEDVMDTWATSSVSPQIAGYLLDDPALYARLFPMALRPHAHDIIRTWTFYTIVRSHFLSGNIPWRAVMISGHALDPAGRKISKSKRNAAVDPAALIARHGADAIRYWACRGGLGADQPLTEDTIRQGSRLAAKLWSAARLIADRIAANSAPTSAAPASPADRALRSWLQRLVEQVTTLYRAYDYAAALELVERFFWGTFCDNYLELAKGRMYDGAVMERNSALATASGALLTILKLLAPVMPHITDDLYQRIFAAGEGYPSIHSAPWPALDPAAIDDPAERAGQALIALASAARRYKTERKLGMGTELARLSIAAPDDTLRHNLAQAATDLRSVTRARAIDVTATPGDNDAQIADGVWASIRSI